MSEEVTGQILKQMRVKANLSTAELAQKIGINQSHIYRLEHGDSDPGLTLVKKWVVATKPDWSLLWALLMPDEYYKWYLKIRGRKRNGN